MILNLKFHTTFSSDVFVLPQKNADDHIKYNFHANKHQKIMCSARTTKKTPLSEKNKPPKLFSVTAIPDETIFFSFWCVSFLNP